MTFGYLAALDLAGGPARPAEGDPVRRARR
jgi:hypothetical protein